jgi:hypothetical protein
LTGHIIDLYGDAVADITPSYSFLLNVTIDGTNLKSTNNILSIGKECFFSPGGGLFDYVNRDVPDITINQTDVTLGAGQFRAVLITMQNYNGAVRRFDFKIDGSNKSIISSKSNPSELLKPLPNGMTIRLQNPYIVEENFKQYDNTFLLSVDTNTPPGDYTIPLEVCYRDINLADSQSPYFPFTRDTSCPFETSLKVHVNY